MQRGLSQLARAASPFAAPGLVASFLLTACARNATTGSIGAVLSQSHRDGRLLVRDVPPHLAAASVGLEKGDEILLIDGRDVRRMSPDDIHKALEGEVGSDVRLSVLHEGEIRRLRLVRTPLAPPRGP